MGTILNALSAVKNASEQDIKKIIEVLDSEGFNCATDPYEGIFESLDVAMLKNLNAKQLTIIQIAQGRSPGW